MANQIDLSGRTAVVTGGAQGIGLAVTQRFLRSGASVVIWDRDAVPGATGDALGALGRWRAVRVDQTDWDGVSKAAAALRGDGGLDILVNNAGIAGANAPVWDYPVDEWKRVLDIDLTGPFHCCKALVPLLREKGYGRVVNVASIAGKEGNPNAAAYSAAKAGVIALTKSLGKELAGQNIAVNCITPAAAKTAIFDQMTPEHIAFMLSKIPRARFVEVEEIANLVAWLASEENSFTTGAVFDISGGRATY